MIYSVGSSLFVYDSLGTVTKKAGSPGPTLAAVGTTKGHVISLSQASAGGYSLYEIDRQGNILQTIPLGQTLSPFARLKTDASGNVYLFDGSNTLFVFDSSLRPITTKTIPYSPKGFAGVDSAGDIYVCDGLGNDGYSVLSASGAFKYSVGPGGLYSPPSGSPTYKPVFAKPVAATLDPSTR